MIASVKKIIGHESDIGSDVLALVASAKVPLYLMIIYMRK